MHFRPVARASLALFASHMAMNVRAITGQLKVIAAIAFGPSLVYFEAPQNNHNRADALAAFR